MQDVISGGAPSLMFCGHAHERMVRRVGPMVVINAGTLLDMGPGCFGLVELELCAARFFEFEARSADIARHYDVDVSRVTPV